MGRSWLSGLVVLALTLAGRGRLAADPPVKGPAAATKIPIILDTDIGGDIDDTWALALLLKSPEFDVKLIVSDTGDTVYRARIIAGCSRWHAARTSRSAWGFARRPMEVRRPRGWPATTWPNTPARSARTGLPRSSRPS